VILNISFIGNGGHAKRIKNVLHRLDISFNEVVFLRDILLSDQKSLIESDIIFITSPNNTHASYLRDLSGIYKGYIYCEKPPVNELKDVDLFDKIDHRKCFFGFNLRYSKIHTILSKYILDFRLGGLVSLKVHVSYPFSIKKEYLSSWKSDITKSPQGVVENLAIHYIDMCIEFLGDISRAWINSINISGNGSAADTANIVFKHSKCGVSNIFSSYATTYQEEIYFTFEGGDVVYNGESFAVYSPRESFDNNGLAIRPKISKEQKLYCDTLYNDSIEKCVQYFIGVVLDKKDFNVSIFNQSRKTIEAMLNVK